MAHRVFVEQTSLANTRVEIGGEDHHHLTRSLRARIGDAVVVCDGKGTEADGVITAIDKRVALVETGAARMVAQSSIGYRMHAVVALIKGERMDYAVQKLVELGVTSIQPMVSARTVVTVGGERAQKKTQRLDSIARSAAQQCHTAWLPAVAAPLTFADALATAPNATRLLFDVAPTAASFESALPPKGCEDVAFLIGPEGGLTTAEVEQAKAGGWKAVSLGPLVLRAETAALAAAAVIGHLGRTRQLV